VDVSSFLFLRIGSSFCLGGPVAQAGPFIGLHCAADGGCGQTTTLLEMAVSLQTSKPLALIGGCGRQFLLCLPLAACHDGGASVVVVLSDGRMGGGRSGGLGVLTFARSDLPVAPRSRFFLNVSRRKPTAEARMHSSAHGGRRLVGPAIILDHIMKGL